MNDFFNKFGNYIYLNGEMLKPDKAKTSVMSHALHYATGVFEGVRAYKTKDGQVIIFRLEDHAIRLINSAKLYNINFDLSVNEVKQIIIDTVKANEFEECYIRPLIFLSEGFNTISITDKIKVNFMVACWPLNGNDSDMKVSFSSYARLHSSQVPMQAKAISNYMNSILIRTEAKNNGYDDSIALDINGYVSELSTSNIFIVKDGVVITPDLSSSILNGLTRISVIKILKDEGYTVVERKVARDEIAIADEIFVTGTACEIKRIVQVDNFIYQKDDVANLLKNKFRKIVTAEDENYLEWLEYVV